MPTSSPSLRCRHCRADNDPGATACWLCGAPDWSPVAYGRNPAKEVGPVRTPIDFDAGAVLAVLMFTAVLVVLGLAKRYMGLAVVVGTFWWLTLGFMVVRRRRLHLGEVRESLVTAGMLAAGLIGLLFIAAFVVLLIVCSRGELPGRH